MKKYKFLVGGEWRSSSKMIEVTNPYTKKIFAEVFAAAPEDVEDAVSYAQEAFEETRTLPSHVRSKICSQIAQELCERKEEMAKIIAMESGKPLFYSRSEVDRAISTFTIASEEAKRIGGELIPLDITDKGENRIGITRRFPIGPVACISPFNYPLNLVVHKIAPALACGNPIVLKPASATPLTSLTLAEIVMGTALPKKALSVLPMNRGTATPLIEDDRFKLITFTGSCDVGWNIKNRAKKKKVSLELGGNGAVVIHEDANIDYATERCTMGAFAFSGQVCTAVQRIYVHENIYDEFIKKFIDETNELVIGDPLNERTGFGPMIDLENAKRIEEWVDEAVEHGSTVLIGGKRDGLFYYPTILTDVDKNLRINKKEAFGPIAVVYRYKKFEDAIKEVNDSIYGLQAGIFVKDVALIMKGFEKIDVGGLMINDVPTFRVDNMPFGGVKSSGFGREGVKYAIEEMTEIKVMVLNLN